MYFVLSAKEKVPFAVSIIPQEKPLSNKIFDYLKIFSFARFWRLFLWKFHKRLVANAGAVC